MIGAELPEDSSAFVFFGYGRALRSARARFFHLGGFNAVG
jgi:hypothetical protein